jgi:hypothetical protein
MGAVIVAVIAVLVALGCFIAITMSDFGGKKKKEQPKEPPKDDANS